MNFKKITDDLSVGEQIGTGDMGAITKAGFRSLICNRPDGESPGQPKFEELEVAARAAGLEIRYQPVRPGRVTNEDALKFLELHDALPKPVLAFCRSGARSVALWGIAKSQK